jgi:hypothetical protein
MPPAPRGSRASRAVPWSEGQAPRLYQSIAVLGPTSFGWGSEYWFTWPVVRPAEVAGNSSAGICRPRPSLRELAPLAFLSARRDTTASNDEFCESRFKRTLKQRRANLRRIVGEALAWSHSGELGSQRSGSAAPSQKPSAFAPPFPVCVRQTTSSTMRAGRRSAADGPSRSAWRMAWGSAQDLLDPTVARVIELVRGANSLWRGRRRVRTSTGA